MKQTWTRLLLGLFLLSSLAGCGGTPESTPPTDDAPPELETTFPELEEAEPEATLYYQGHGSLRITTAEGKVIYIDPYAGDGYDLPADLILVTHQHPDHNQTDLVVNRSDDCLLITQDEALEGGSHRTFDLGYVTVEAVEAGYNPNHDVTQCVGYILTLSDGTGIYVSGDTSTTPQMVTFADRRLDYAFLCCDGQFNMDSDEASACAEIIGAKHTIPYHMMPGELFDRGRAESLTCGGLLIVEAGENLVL